jgi:hypothetical protein
LSPSWFKLNKIFRYYKVEENTSYIRQNYTFITRNYLYILWNYIGDLFYPRSSFDDIRSSIRNIRNNQYFQPDFERSRAISKIQIPKARQQDFFIDKRNKRYKLLDENIFQRVSKLSLIPSSDEGISEDRLKLYFTDNISEIKESPYFNEARKHLAIDLPNYLLELDILEGSVTKLNKDVDKFFHRTVSDKVKNYLMQQMTALSISYERADIVPMNSISLPRLISFLTEHWLSVRDFDINYDDANGNFSLDHTNIATIPQELEAGLRDAVEQLKGHYEINSDIAGLRKSAENLINKSDELAKQIRNNILVPIEKEEYNTVCDECPKNKD